MNALSLEASAGKEVKGLGLSHPSLTYLRKCSVCNKYIISLLCKIFSDFYMCKIITLFESQLYTYQNLNSDLYNKFIMCYTLNIYSAYPWSIRLVRK